MAALTRTFSGTPVCLADAHRLPVCTGSIERLLCTYVLDLLPAGDLSGAVGESIRGEERAEAAGLARLPAPKGVRARFCETPAC